MKSRTCCSIWWRLWMIEQEQKTYTFGVVRFYFIVSDGDGVGDEADFFPNNPLIDEQP